MPDPTPFRLWRATLDAKTGAVARTGEVLEGA